MGGCLTEFCTDSESSFGFCQLPSPMAKLTSVSIKKRVYCAEVRSVLIYGSETWPLRVEDTRNLLVFDDRCLRNIAEITGFDFLAKELTTLFTKVCELDSVQTSWNESTVVLIFKKGSRRFCTDRSSREVRVSG
ncbi:unnamed protein product [Schistosoma mattheei]|uniref:Uncharacterized protein n=1 Tax=Schistosoma mattheei TaxID=31246 RepID=A0A183NLF8_9TREM|nr:unnamed protein product [Schistosoma mattheei]